MEEIQIGDRVKSDYGKGVVLVATKQWLIHDDSLNNSKQEFAILLSDETVQLLQQAV